MDVPLAAKATSPSSAIKNIKSVTSFHVFPLSLVCRSWKVPSVVGSPTTNPWRPLKSIPSRKASGRPSRYTSFHDVPPSSVRRMTAGLPALITNASLSEKTAISRKSNVSYPAGVSQVQCIPPSIDFPIVPDVPLTHTSLLCVAMPRKLTPCFWVNVSRRCPSKNVGNASVTHSRRVLHFIVYHNIYGISDNAPCCKTTARTVYPNGLFTHFSSMVTNPSCPGDPE